MRRILRLLHPRACPAALCAPYLALLITFASMTVVSVVVTLYAFWLAATNHGVVDPQRMSVFGRMTGEHFGPAITLLLATLCARWLAAERGLGPATAIALGVALSLIGMGIGWSFGHAPDAGDAAFALVLVAAALLGGWLGRRERDAGARRARLSDALAAAATADELARLLAAELGPGVAVDLWADAGGAPRWLGGSAGTPGPAAAAHELVRCGGDGHAVSVRGGHPPRRLHAFAATLCICLQRLELRAEGARVGARAERERLAGDIHDTIAQSLLGVTTHLEAAGSALSSRPADAGQHVATAVASARTALAELRGLVWALRPPESRASLAEALRRSAERVAAESGTRVEVEVVAEGLPELPPEAELCLLRAAQEALRNAIRHGDARRVDLSLATEGDGTVRLCVADDGNGCAPGTGSAAAADADGGHGLAALRARAAALGGTLEVKAGPERGTQVVVRLPPRAAGERR